MHTKLTGLKNLCLLLLLLPSLVMAQSANNDWENPQFFELNKERPHATFMLFDNKQDVINDDYSKSSYYQSLNGSCI